MGVKVCPSGGYEGEVREALARRRVAWREMADDRRPLGDMEPGARAEAEALAAEFRSAGIRLVEYLRLAGGPVELPDGRIVRLNEDGDGPAFVYPEAGMDRTRLLAQRARVARLDLADLLRAGVGRAS